MNENAQFEKMTETSVDKLVLTLALPTTISTLVTNIYNLADTYFVGTISNSASAATGVVFSLMTIIQAFGFMLGHGAGTNISRLLGEKNYEKAKRFSADSFYLSIMTGLLICLLANLFMNPLLYLLGSTDTILPYARTYAFYILLAAPAMASGCVMNNILRYEGKAFFAMIGLSAGGILNIFGDWLFFKLNMGIAGAGLATAISQYISMIILIYPFVTRKVESTISLKYFHFNLNEFSKIFYNGMPSLARQGLNAISTMILNNTAGLYGDAIIAAMSVVTRITNFAFCIALGIGQGFQPVSAFNYGAKLYSRVKEAFLCALKFGTLVMLIISLFTYFKAEYLISLFRNDSEVIKAGSLALRYQSIVMFLLPFVTYVNMQFQSVGRGLAASYVASLRSGLCFLPILLIFNNKFGLSGLQLAQPCADILSFILAFPLIIYFFKHLPKDGQTI